jgi:hypothetical protein
MDKLRLLSEDCRSIRFAAGFLFALYLISVLSVSPVHATGFSTPTVVPIGSKIQINYDKAEPPYEYGGPKVDYQVRFVNLINENTLRVRAAKVAGGAHQEVAFSIDLEGFGEVLAKSHVSRHSLTLYQGYQDSTEDAGCPGWLDDYSELLTDVRILEEGYISEEDHIDGANCDRIVALNDYVFVSPKRPLSAHFEAAREAIFISRAGKVLKIPVPSNFSLQLADRGLGAVAKKIDNSHGTEVVALEVQNSFWAILAIDPKKSIGLLLGPTIANPNRGFIPRSLSVAPGRKLTFAAIAPRAESSLWGISVFESKDGSANARLVATVGADGIAYSEHRGFDHSVSWTGPNSMIFLDRGGLTINHVELDKGEVKVIGSRVFNEGDVFSIAGEVAGYRWTQELKLFRLEAISALPLPSGKDIRIAAVGIFNYQTAERFGQVSLPLIMDVPWNLEQGQ